MICTLAVCKAPSVDADWLIAGFNSKLINFEKESKITAPDPDDNTWEHLKAVETQGVVLLNAFRGIPVVSNFTNAQ